MHRSRAWYGLFSLLVTALVAAVLMLYLAEHWNELPRIESEQVYWWLAAAVLIVVRTCAMAWINWDILRCLGVCLGAGEAFGLAVLTTVGNQVLPFQAGAAFRAVYLKRTHDFPISRFIATIGGVQVSLVLVTSLVAIFCLLVVVPVGRDVRGAIAVIGSAACLLASVAVVSLPRNWLAGWRFLSKLSSMVDAWHTLREDRALLRRVVAGCFVFRLCDSGCFYLVCSAMGLEVSAIDAVAITNVAAIAAHVTVTPGGVGIYEGIVCFVCEPIGITVLQGLTVALTCRFLLVSVSTALAVPSAYVLFRRSGVGA